MPTPRDSTTQLQLAIDPHLERPSHTTCPTELERPGGWGADGEARPDSDNVIGGDVMRHEATPPLEIDDHSPVGLVNQDNPPRTKTMTMDQDNTEAEGSSPMSITTEPKDTDSSLPSTAMSSAVGSYSSVNYGIPNVRVCGAHSTQFQNLLHQANRVADDPEPYLLLLARGQQIQRHAAIRSPELQC